MIKKSDSRAITILDRLVRINNSRIEGYTLVEKQAICSDTIRCLFSRLVQSGHEFRRELNLELEKLGERPDEGPVRNGNTFWLWFDLKAGDTNEQREIIFDACEAAEARIIDVYRDILEQDKNRNFIHVELIKKQYDLLQEDLVRIKNLRKTFVKGESHLQTKMEVYTINVKQTLRKKYFIPVKNGILNFVRLKGLRYFIAERILHKKLSNVQDQKTMYRS